MTIRTDLALEKHEMHRNTLPDGVKMKEYSNADCKATVIEITDCEGAKIIEKPEGTYITLEMDSFPDSSTVTDGRFDMLTEMLSSLIPENGSVLVAGLGNTDITADSIGPLCAEQILATRHIPEETAFQLELPRLRPVSVIATGVMGKTGIETGEIIAGIKEKIKPSVIILIDALAARSIGRLGKTVQLSNTGICPGSGVGNKRKEISSNTMGIPVISVGIPTVVDTATLVHDLTGEEKINDGYSHMLVMPKDADIIVSGGARLISLALNSVLQKNLTKEEIISLCMQ